MKIYTQRLAVTAPEAALPSISQVHTTYCHTCKYVRSDTEWHMALYSIYDNNNVIEYQYHATISDGCLQQI